MKVKIKKYLRKYETFELNCYRIVIISVDQVCGKMDILQDVNIEENWFIQSATLNGAVVWGEQ